ncbi:hypothetical protein Dimus_012332 [Dionaea muscipula]
MALTIPHTVSLSPSFQISPQNAHFRYSVSAFRCSSFRFLKIKQQNRRVICSAASAAGSSSSDGNMNPYEILGVRPIEGFDMIKAAYTKRRKEAERRGDKDATDKIEMAYDKIMMEQLTKRKKGETFGSIKVSKEIKYADRQPLIPWAPRFLKSDVKDTRINLAISAAFAAWILFRPGDEWKPLQILAFIFVYRVFEKLKSFEPSVSPTFTEDGEDEGRYTRMGKRLVRALVLVFGCMTLTCLMFTGIMNLFEYMAGSIPAFLRENQARLITVSSSVMLYYLASFYC